MFRLGLIGLLLVAAVGDHGGCQTITDASVDIGGAVLRQSGLAETNVLTAAGQLRFLTPIFSLSSNGIAARTPEDRYTGQAVISASRYAPPVQRLRWELGATGNAFGLSNAGPSFGWQLLAREHLGWSLGGIFAGAAAGTVTQSRVSRRVVNAHTGGFFLLDALGRDELSGALAYTDAGVVPQNGLALQYADAIAYWTHRTHRFELLAGGGFRVNADQRSRFLGWASASAVFWVTASAGIVLSAGHALEDAARGVPSARYLSASIRFGNSSTAQRAVTGIGRTRRDNDGAWIDVRANSDSLRVVTMHLPLATAVELMADFTDWEAIGMTRLPNGDWTIERIIAPGTHRVAIRVDGGRWMAPPKLPSVTDDFGGEVGLLIVP